ncbi:MAG: DUF4327 family protein [Cyanobacteria bacterium J06554_6]
MTQTITKPLVRHPMAKFQRQVQSLVDTRAVKQTDHLWKMALLFGDRWTYWKAELEDFDFSMRDPISDLLAVENWDED